MDQVDLCPLQVCKHGPGWVTDVPLCYISNINHVNTLLKVFLSPMAVQEGWKIISVIFPCPKLAKYVQE